MRLTSEQQQIVINHYSMTRGIAHIIWRAANLPARYLEEMYQEALLRLCTTVMTFNIISEENIKFTVSKHLWKLVKKYRHTTPIPMDEWVREEASSISETEGGSDLVDILLQAFQSLSPPQQIVIEKRYGLAGGGMLSQREIANDLGKGQANV